SVGERGHRVVKLPEEIDAPLGIEPGAACAVGLGDPLVVLEIFRDGYLPGLALADETVDPLAETPAIGEIVGRIVVVVIDVADGADGVPAETVGVALLQPAHGVIANVFA